MKAQSSTRGWTHVDQAIALLLASAVLGQTVLVARSVLALDGESAAALAREKAGRAVLERIALAVQGADQSALLPATLAGFPDDRFSYALQLGVTDGSVVRSAPEEICLSGTRLEWTENPGTTDARTQAWADLVSPLLEGERLNGIDDNGNGWVDERGLAIELDGARATLRLTVERPGPDGQLVPDTVVAVVARRN